MQWHLANILTVGRLALVPFFLLFFLLGFYPGAFIVFVLASFTDLIDGSIARFFKQHSQLGALLDPIADKLLMIATFACLASIRIVPTWFLILIVFKDVTIMSGIGALKILKIEVKYEPFISSKLSTLAQMALGTLALGSLWNPAFQFGAYPLIDFVEGLIYATSVLVVVGLLQYVRKGIEILQEKHGEKGSIRKPWRKAVS